MPDKEAMRLGGLILAGGRSRRMGRAKESLPIGDTTLLGWQCRTLAACTDPVVVVRRDDGQALPDVPESVDVTADDAPGIGPLCGLAAGLARLHDRHGFGDRDAAFVTGCDLPFVTAATVRWLAARLGDDDLLMPRAAGALQPLLAIYRIGVLDRALGLLAAGERSLHALAGGAGAVLDEERLRQHDPELTCLFDIDDPASYDAALRALAEGRP